MNRIVLAVSQVSILILCVACSESRPTSSAVEAGRTGANAEVQSDAVRSPTFSGEMNRLLGQTLELSGGLVVPPRDDPRGDRPGQRSPFIVGGSTAAPGEFPWMAFMTHSGDARVRCSGALIDGSWVLTAAHCVRGSDSVQHGDDVYVGYVNPNADGGHKTTIRRTIFHEQHDVALIELEVQAGLAALPLNSNLITPPQIATIIGFGRDGQSNDHVLKYAPAGVVSADACSEISGHASSDAICVADQQGGICYGDSGGPLLSGSDADWQLIGVASAIGHVSQCGANSEGLRVGSFARATSYLDWIAEKTGGLGPMPVAPTIQPRS